MGAAKGWRNREDEEKKGETQDPSEEDKKRKPGYVVGKEYLRETAEFAAMRSTKKQKGEGTFGWDVFNQDSLYRAHDKRVAQVQFQNDEYEEQKAAIGEGSFYANDAASSVGGMGFKPTEE